MLKKSAFIFLMLVVVLFCTYAEKGKYNITVKASPYSFQYIKYGQGFSSKYGYSVELGYRHYVWKGHSVGVDLKYQNYDFKELSDKYYHVISAAVKAGWTQMFGEKWCLDSELGFGIQGRKVDTAKDLFLYLSLYVGGGYHITQNIRITAGFVFEPTFQMDSNDYIIGAMLGTYIGL